MYTGSTSRRGRYVLAKPYIYLNSGNSSYAI